MSKFSLGDLVCTAGVAEKIKEDRSFAAFIQESLEQFNDADWGDLYDEDKELNEEALRDGDGRLMGAYIYKPRENESIKIWIITEWDRSATTVLFPEEY